MKRDSHNKSLLKCEYNKYLIIVFYVFCIFPGSKKKKEKNNLRWLTQLFDK